MKKLVFLILLLSIILSCSKDSDQNSQTKKTIIFGEIYGNCAGDCRTLFLLTEEGIYKDSDSDTEFGKWEHTTFENQGLAINKFELAISLLEIPNGLLVYEREVGYQTWADFDYFLHLNVNGKTKTWIFDEVNENTNAEITAYIENLIQIIKLLRN
ncbi:MAG: hypothetical protein COB60_08070 [Flavobacteriaceae bacterium]|nr:MAG: hypothetical protein COB60_08070 [Flavobacteriaceae bacterium]